MMSNQDIIDEIDSIESAMADALGYDPVKYQVLEDQLKDLESYLGENNG